MKSNMEQNYQEFSNRLTNEIRMQHINTHAHADMAKKPRGYAGAGPPHHWYIALSLRIVVSRTVCCP